MGQIFVVVTGMKRKKRSSQFDAALGSMDGEIFNVYFDVLLAVRLTITLKKCRKFYDCYMVVDFQLIFISNKSAYNGG